MTLYDTVVIGAGPGGMTAAMYAARSELKVLLLERGAPGGQMNNTAEIENYPGYETIMGPDLSMKMHEPLEGLGVENAYGIVQNVTVNADGIKQVITEDEVFEAKTVIPIGQGRRVGLPVIGSQRIVDDRTISTTHDLGRVEGRADHHARV